MGPNILKNMLHIYPVVQRIKENEVFIWFNTPTAGDDLCFRHCLRQFMQVELKNMKKCILVNKIGQECIYEVREDFIYVGGMNAFGISVSNSISQVVTRKIKEILSVKIMY